ncbi:MAG: PEP-CTERM sorting domain-containing protein [bacterium]|nr:PEP-CTERM sorting domain-containing protein [bacterium]
MQFRNTLLTISLGLVLCFICFFAGQAQALNRIDLTLTTPDPAPGELVDVLISMNFDETTFGGSVALSYDQSVLSFNSFAFDPAFTANFGFSEPVAGSEANPLDISFGWFFVPSPMGDTPIGTFRFLADAPVASTSILTSEVITSPFEGSTSSLVVEFGSTDLTVIPEPGTALLLLSGLAALATTHRRSVRPL